MEMLQVKYVPADPELPEELKEVPNDLSIFKVLVDGWVEIVKTPHMMQQQIVMLVNDNGWNQGLPINRRAQERSQYPGKIVGDAVFVGWNYHPDSDWHDYPESIDLTHS